jgi:hypothetical protein
VFFVERMPRCATFLHRAKIAVGTEDVLPPLNKLNAEASGDVEWDVTMHLKVLC